MGIRTGNSSAAKKQIQEELRDIQSEKFFLQSEVDISTHPTYTLTKEGMGNSHGMVSEENRTLSKKGYILGGEGVGLV